jgi:RIO kinase 2
MSSAQIAAKSLKDLEPEDWTVLRALEKFISEYESVPERIIEKESGFHHDQVLFRLGRLNYFGFVMGSRFGYILNTAGLDALALKTLVTRNFIASMGASIGMGKESDVFEVVSDSGQQSVIKFYRIGRVSFRTTRKTRSYVSSENQHQWLEINVGAAQKEAQGLTQALKAKVNVPRFIARDRHAVLMSEIEGTMLFKCTEEDIKRPRTLMKEVLLNVRRAFTKAKMINGDVSEYNILFDGKIPWIIDWPQFVPTSHSNAAELIRRDVINSISFFRRKFAISVEIEDAVSYVTGKSLKLKIN